VCRAGRTQKTQNCRCRTAASPPRNAGFRARNFPVAGGAQALKNAAGRGQAVWQAVEVQRGAQKVVPAPVLPSWAAQGAPGGACWESSSAQHFRGLARKHGLALKETEAAAVRAAAAALVFEPAREPPPTGQPRSSGSAWPFC